VLIFYTPDTSLQLKLQVRFWRNVWVTLPETVLAQQIGSERGDELLAPDKKDNDKSFAV
jgi:hypothetical protein